MRRTVPLWIQEDRNEECAKKRSEGMRELKLGGPPSEERRCVISCSNKRLDKTNSGRKEGTIIDFRGGGKVPEGKRKRKSGFSDLSGGIGRAVYLKPRSGSNPKGKRLGAKNVLKSKCDRTIKRQKCASANLKRHVNLASRGGGRCVSFKK